MIVRSQEKKVTGQLQSNADIVVHPQVSTSGINLGIPGTELGERDARSRVDQVTVIARLDLVKGFAIARDARHLRLGPRGRRLGSRDGCCGARDVHADVVVQPEVRAC